MEIACVYFNGDRMLFCIYIYIYIAKHLLSFPVLLLFSAISFPVLLLFSANRQTGAIVMNKSACEQKGYRQRPYVSTEFLQYIYIYIYIYIIFVCNNLYNVQAGKQTYQLIQPKMGHAEKAKE